MRSNLMCQSRIKKGEDYSKRMENVRNWMAIQRIKKNFNPTTIDGWINKHIAGNENRDYKGYAAVNLEFEKGMNILTAETAVFSLGTSIYISGTVSAFEIIQSANTLDDITGIGRKYILNNENANYATKSLYNTTKSGLELISICKSTASISNNESVSISMLDLVTSLYGYTNSMIEGMKYKK